VVQASRHRSTGTGFDRRRRGDAPGVLTRGDRERARAAQERQAAELEHELAARAGPNAAFHLKAARMHLEAAETHERFARLVDAQDARDSLV
jgi:hypothetical protein